MIAIFLITTIVGNYISDVKPDEFCNRFFSALSSGCLVCLLLIRFFPAAQRARSNSGLNSGAAETSGTEMQEFQKPPSFEEALSMPLLKDEAQLRRPLTDSDTLLNGNQAGSNDECEPPSYQEALKENTSQFKE